jgi:hypothetical protein
MGPLDARADGRPVCYLAHGNMEQVLPFGGMELCGVVEMQDA